MVQALLILTFFLARFRDVLDWDDSNASFSLTHLEAALPYVGAAVLACAFHIWCLYVGQRLDTRGSVRLVDWTHRLMLAVRISAFSFLAFSVFVLHWDAWVRSRMGERVLLDELAIALPVLAIITSTWWSIAPIERRLRDALLIRDIERGNPISPIISSHAWVWSQLRHQVLLLLIPIALLLTWSEACDRFPAWLAAFRYNQAAAIAAKFSGVAQFIGALIVILLTPLLLRLLWDTVRLGPGELDDSVKKISTQYRVRLNGPWVWRTYGQVVNAAILGMLHPFRYLLLTDALLERLTLPQVQVVIAHEVAHVRQRHLPWLAGATLGSVLACAWIAELILRFAPPTPQDQTTTTMLASVACMLVGFLVFGAVSRRFEWQADAFALAHITASASFSRTTSGIVEQPDAQLVAQTLGSVARLNGMNSKTFTWRHGSIADRQRRVLANVGERITNLPINRQVTIIKAVAAVLVVLSLVSLFKDM